MKKFRNNNTFNIKIAVSESISALKEMADS